MSAKSVKEIREYAEELLAENYSAEYAQSRAYQKFGSEYGIEKVSLAVGWVYWCNSSSCNYEQQQIDELGDGQVKIKLTSDSCDSTNWLNVSSEQLSQIREILGE